MFGNNGGGKSDFGGGGFGGGGFSASQGGDGEKEQRKFRFINITPITCQNMDELVHEDSKFTLGGAEVSQVTLVGNIYQCEKTQTCNTYKLDDTTGSVTIKHWRSVENEEEGMMEEDDGNVFEEGKEVKVFGQIRSFQKVYTLNALKIRPVEDMNEITVHMLECIKYKLMRQKKASGNMNGASNGGNAAMYNSNTGGGNLKMNGSSNDMGMDSVQHQVWQMIENYSAQSSEGVAVDDIRSTLKGLSMPQIRKAVEFLSNEGHIYSTVDDNHYKSTSH